MAVKFNERRVTECEYATADHRAWGAASLLSPHAAARRLTHCGASTIIFRRTSSPVLFHSGYDALAKVGVLINGLGFFGIDLGSLAVGARFVQFRWRTDTCP